MVMPEERKLKVLYVTEFLPWPLNSGGRIRSYNILYQASLRHEVTLVSTYMYDDQLIFHDFVHQVHAVKIQNRSRSNKIYRAFKFMFSHSPFLRVYSTYHKEIEDKLRILLKDNSYDLIHLDQLDAAAYLPLCAGIPVYLDEHNYETKLIQTVINNTTNFFLRSYLKQQCRKLEDFEKTALKNSDAVGVVSENDLDLVTDDIPYEKVKVIPNGVDLEHFDINRLAKARKLVSIGSLDWKPNVNGLLWFLDHVWPQVLHYAPDATFDIVGRNPPECLLKRANDSVSIFGSVPDIRDYVMPASVFVVPLFSGGGTRLKVLEAMAMRIPLVSTTTGVEGIECTEGFHALISDDPEVFADNIIKLLNNEDMAQDLACASRKLVEKKYSWNAIGEKLDACYRMIVKN